MADIVNPGAAAGGPLNSGAMPSNQDLVIYKGDFMDLFVTLKDSSNVAINITGATPKAQLKSDYDDVTPIDFTCTLTGTTGQVKISLTSTQSATLVPGDYIWDFQVTQAGATRTYLQGDVKVYPEVTT